MYNRWAKRVQCATCPRTPLLVVKECRLQIKTGLVCQVTQLRFIVCQLTLQILMVLRLQFCGKTQTTEVDSRLSSLSLVCHVKKWTIDSFRRKLTWYQSFPGVILFLVPSYNWPPKKSFSTNATQIRQFFLMTFGTFF